MLKTPYPNLNGLCAGADERGEGGMEQTARSIVAYVRRQGHDYSRPSEPEKLQALSAGWFDHRIQGLSRTESLCAGSTYLAGGRRLHTGVVEEGVSGVTGWINAVLDSSDELSRGICTVFSAAGSEGRNQYKRGQYHGQPGEVRPTRTAGAYSLSVGSCVVSGNDGCDDVSLQHNHTGDDE